MSEDVATMDTEEGILWKNVVISIDKTNNLLSLLNDEDSDLEDERPNLTIDQNLQRLDLQTQIEFSIENVKAEQVPTNIKVEEEAAENVIKTESSFKPRSNKSARRDDDMDIDSTEEHSPSKFPRGSLEMFSTRRIHAHINSVNAASVPYHASSVSPPGLVSADISNGTDGTHSMNHRDAMKQAENVNYESPSSLRDAKEIIKKMATPDINNRHLPATPSPPVIKLSPVIKTETTSPIRAQSRLYARPSPPSTGTSESYHSSCRESPPLRPQSQIRSFDSPQMRQSNGFPSVNGTPQFRQPTIFHNQTPIKPDPFVAPRNRSFNHYEDEQKHRNCPQVMEQITINDIEYTILKKVGEGSAGKVFQVFSHRYNDIFALKWIELKRPPDKEAIVNEIMLMKSLNRNNFIVQLLDFKITQFAIYIIMEYGEVDLNNLIKSQYYHQWDITFIRHYWRQMLYCVNAIHSEGVVHTDLKPANFVVVKGRLKLIDFGIAKNLSDDTTNIHRESQMGTINYMSPEALTDRSNGNSPFMSLGKASDVWSLACILYQMVYGATPFAHLTLHQKLRCIPDPEVEIKFGTEAKFGDSGQTVQVPQMVIDLLKSCFERNDTLRPLTTELMQHKFVTEA